jgi:RAB protein geranylgeranyltransferase component A
VKFTRSSVWCRLSAVHGSIYILSHPITSIDFPSSDDASSAQTHPISLQIKGFTHPILASHLIASPDYLPSSSSSSTSATEESKAPARVARCIAILDVYPTIFPLPAAPPPAEDGGEETGQQAEEVEKPDASLLVFPPGSLVAECEHTVQALLVGEGTGSCPRGQCELQGPGRVDLIHVGG